MSQVQGAVNGPDLQYLNYQDHAEQSATSSTYPQQDAIQSCPALIVLKEDYNNNNSVSGLEKTWKRLQSLVLTEAEARVS